MELLLVRHAVTAANLNYTMMGRSDYPLHELGRRQANAAAEALRQARIDAIVTSPLQRAQATASAIAAFHPDVPMHVEPDLQELDLGVVEGLSSLVAYQRYQKWMDDALLQGSADFAFPDGELRSHALARFKRAIIDTALRFPEGRVVMVSHGGPIGLWFAHHYGQPLGAFRRYQPEHASVTNVHVMNDGVIRNIGETQTNHISDALRKAIEAFRNH